MKKTLTLVIALASLMMLQRCSKSGTTEPNPSPPPSSGGLAATPSSVRLLPGANATVVVSGGSKPDTILIASASNIATATLADTVVTIQGVAVGTTSVRIGDHSAPQKMVDIGITVATTPVAVMITAGPR